MGSTAVADEKSDRRMFIECSIMLAICVAIVGIWAFCIIRKVSQSEPTLPITQEGVAIQEQFSNLSENDQWLIVKDWMDEQQTENAEPPDNGYDLED
jgi:hypothetical protein